MQAYEKLGFFRLIEESADLPWDGLLFCSNSEHFDDPQNLFCVLSESEVNSVSGRVEPISQNLRTFCYVCSVSTFQDVVHNVREQLEQPSSNDYERALTYYLEHDAFMAFDHLDHS